MIEQYFLDELKNIKEENEKLRKENQDKDNKFLVLEEREQVKVELISNDALFRKLEENNIDLNCIVDEMGTKEVQALIKDLCLYRDAKKDDYVAIVKINNSFYGLEKYYNDFKLINGVFVDLDEAIYGDLVDRLYDKVQNELDRRKQEQKEVDE